MPEQQILTTATARDAFARAAQLSVLRRIAHSHVRDALDALFLSKDVTRLSLVPAVPPKPFLGDVVYDIFCDIVTPLYGRVPAPLPPPSLPASRDIDAYFDTAVAASVDGSVKAS